MAVYDLQDNEWDKIRAYWENGLLDEYKDHTVFQMEVKSITFISNIPEVVEDVSKRFGINENKFCTSIGAHGIKRLTGENSKWKDVPMKKIIEYVPMTKDQLKKALTKLKEFYREFSLEYNNYKNGKNKNIRENGYSNLKRTIQFTKKFLCSTEEILEILCDGDTSAYGRAIILDEFSSPEYYEKDMSKLIQDVEDKLEDMV